MQFAGEATICIVGRFNTGVGNEDLLARAQSDLEIVIACAGSYSRDEGHVTRCKDVAACRKQ